MDDRARVVGATLAGALLGGVVGYLYMTRQGRELREAIEPRLDDLLAEVRRLRQAAGKLRAVVAEGRQSIDEVVGRSERAPEWVTSYRSNAGF